jgi:hypothetical protein
MALKESLRRDLMMSKRDLITSRKQLGWVENLNGLGDEMVHFISCCVGFA